MEEDQVRSLRDRLSDEDDNSDHPRGIQALFGEAWREIERLEGSLALEGLAAQMYVADHGGSRYVWWHLLREDLKVIWREYARVKIAEFEKRYALPEEKM